ncbi:MAG: response regulator [Flavobacteriales bacterium]|nr:response regulator [Flavobacteriales bacterium]
MTATEKIKIFVVEDDKFYNHLLGKHIKTMERSPAYSHLNFEVHSYYTADECLTNLDKDPAIIILDYYLDNELGNGQTGLDALREIRKCNKESKVIMFSAQSEMVMTVELMKAGAYDYVTKDNSSIMRVEQLIHKIIKEKEAKKGSLTAKIGIGALIFVLGVILAMKLI